MDKIESVADIALRLDLRAESGYTWFALIPADVPGENSVADVRDELEVILGIPVRTITAGRGPIHSFVEAIMSSPSDTVLLSGLDDWTEEDWAALDIQRSALERSGAITLMLSPKSILRLSNYAPNIRSFIGGSIVQLAPGGGVLSETERRRRVKELEESYGLTSEQVIERAKAKTLAPDPIFVEWLVLLGHGDVV